MGHGDFGDGEVVLHLTFGFLATPTDIDDWTTCLKEASKMLFHATAGTVRIARVVHSNDSTGGEGADAWVTRYDQLYFSSTHASVAEGFSGTGNVSMTLAGSAVDHPFIVLHEFGHYAFGLGDEYSDADTQIRCASIDPLDVGVPACIMGVTPVDLSGTLSTDSQNGWITEFCTDQNHLYNANTSQAVEHGTKACATVIQDLHPNVQIATGSPARNSFGVFDAPVWEPADPGSDISYVVDGAAFGAWLAGAAVGDAVMEAANYLSESADSTDDFVASVPYEAPLPHHHVPVTDSIDEAVEVAANMIKQQTRRRATRAIVVFATRPDQLPSMDARAKQLARDGIRVITIGLGQNQAALQTLAQRTNGAYYEVNPRHDANKVRDDLMSFADELRFGPPILKLSSDSSKTKKKTLRIDEGSRRIKFVLSHPPNSSLRLSAEPVDGDAPNPDDEGVTELANPKRSYQSLTVDQPTHGKWVVGIQGPPGVPFTLTAYSHNPQVRVGVRGAERLYPRGQTVKLYAVVSCPAPVVGLSKAVAKVTSPKGKMKEYRLKPGRGGVHSASFMVKEPGSYEVEVIVRNKGGAEPAGLAPKDRASFDAAIDIPTFRRVRRFRVHVM